LTKREAAPTLLDGTSVRAEMDGGER
jgi:hypothetical protein